MESDGGECSSSPPKKPKTERVRTAGQIMSVHLENFMCHKQLLIEFDIKNNNCFYIGGPNGSGKSALFAAINLGLGGSAGMNERGNNVGTFIKDGAEKATITIVLSNEGANAIREHGSSISVKRVIDKVRSKYRLESLSETETGSIKKELISEKKENLDHILLRFNISLTNPIFWLSQDKSRTFLANLKPAMLYDLFMQSSNLETIKSMHLKNNDAITSCFELIDQKEEEIKGELYKVEKMKEQLNMKDQMGQYVARIKVFAWKLLFCGVRDYDDAIKIIDKKITIRKNIHAECKKEYYENRKLRMTKRKKIDETQPELEFMEDEIKEKKEEREENSTKRTSLRQKLNKCNLEVRNCDGQIKQLHEAIKKTEKDLKDHLLKNGNKKLTEDLIAAQTKLESLTEELAQLKNKKSSEMEEEMKLLHSNKEKKYEELIEQKKEIRLTEEKIKREKDLIAVIQATKTNTVNRYGSDMHKILAEIEKNKDKFKKMPKGPLGQYIKLKDKKWALAVEACFGKLASSFLCDSWADYSILDKIFDKLELRSSAPTIIRSEYTGEAYTRLLEPSEEHNTVYRMLTFTDADVHNAIIDATRCEQVLLIEKKVDAMRMLGSDTSCPQNVTSAFTLDASKIIANISSQQYRCYSGYDGRAKNLFGEVTSGQSEQEVRICLEESQKQLDHAKRVFGEKEKSYEEVAQKWKSLYNEVCENDKQIIEKETKIRHSQYSIEDLTTEIEQSLNDDVAGNLTELIEHHKERIPECEERKKAALMEKEETEKQLEDNLKKKKEIDKYFTSLKEEMEKVSAMIVSLKKEIDALDETASVSELRIRKLKEDENKLYLEHAKLKCERDDAIEILEINKQTAVKPDGEQDPPDLSDFPSTDDARKTLQKMQEVVTDQLNSFDRSITYERVQQLRKTHKKSKKMCSLMRDALDKLNLVYGTRKKLLPKLEAAAEKDVCEMFENLLKIRGNFKGGLEFDREKKHLNINVQATDDKDAMLKKAADDGEGSSEPPKKKAKVDMKGLSGGERSFITVALVMALWEVIDQPFRLLDEFDVFMDSMNRKVIIDLLVGVVTELHPSCQFIFFTPQGIKELEKADGLQVFEMKKIQD